MLALALALALASAMNSPPALEYAAASPQNDPFMEPAAPYSPSDRSSLPSNPAQEAKMPRVSPRRLHTLMAEDKGMIVIDARDAFSYRDLHIKGAINVPLLTIERRYRQLPKDRLIALYCT